MDYEKYLEHLLEEDDIRYEDEIFERLSKSEGEEKNDKETIRNDK